MRKLRSEEPISNLNGLTVGDFWSWAYSDILSNRNRAIFAEYLVAVALGATSSPRVEWDGYDLLYNEKRIEVKASGYLQSWKQEKLSKITFDIALKNAWDSTSNTYLNNIERVADCYVFCLYAEKDLTQVDVLNVNAWEFFVATTAQINAHRGNQKSIALGRLRQFSKFSSFRDLKFLIDNVLYETES